MMRIMHENGVMAEKGTISCTMYTELKKKNLNDCVKNAEYLNMSLL